MFFSPSRVVRAQVALACRSTPNQITFLAGVVGREAGLLLHDERLGLCTFGLIILHGVIDSADAQLARMTSQTTEAGFFLDDLSDYYTNTAICVGIAAALVRSSRGHSWRICVSGFRQ